MSGLLAALAGFFVSPQVAAEPERPASRAPQLAAVVAMADDLPSAAGGIAATLRRRLSARTAVVCHAGPAPLRRPATPAAGALARRLAGRELEAVGVGAVCHVGLGAEPMEAIRRLWRVAGAVDVPVVLALPGRPDGFDAVLRQVDHLVLAAPSRVDPAMAELALASLSELGPPATRALPPGGALARRGACLGFMALALDAAAAGIGRGPAAMPEAEPPDPGLGASCRGVAT